MNNTNNQVEQITVDVSRYVLQNQPSIVSVSLFCFVFILIAVLAFAIQE